MEFYVQNANFVHNTKFIKTIDIPNVMRYPEQTIVY